MFEELCNLECPVGLSQREICVHCSEGNLAQFGLSVEKHVELRDVFECSRLALVQIGRSRCRIVSLVCPYEP